MQLLSRLNFWGRLALLGAILVGGWCLALAMDVDPVPQLMTPQAVLGSQPRFTMLATDLADRHRVTPHATNREVGNQVVQLYGKIAQLGRLSDGGSYLTLRGGAKGTLPVICTSRAQRLWDEICPGLLVTVKGQFLPGAPRTSTQVIHIQILEIHERKIPRVRLQAEELLRRLEESPEAGWDELGDTWAWVTGEVATVDRVTGILYLRAGAGCEVQCNQVADAEELDEFEAGQRVEVLGKVAGATKTRVVLNECLPPRLVEPDR